MSEKQEVLISALDRAQASFNHQQDRTGYFDLYDSSLVTHGFPSNLPNNLEGLKTFYNSIWAAFPDSHLEFNDMVVQGDKIAARFTFTGTHRGELLGIPPTGREVSIQCMRFLKFKDKKCIEAWSLMDILSMIQQLGAAPV